MPADAIDTIEPRTRTFIPWTPELLQAAEIQADGGHLRLAADLCEEMLADDRIKAVVDTRTDTLLGLPLAFEGKSKRAVKALEAREDWWAIFPESDLKLLHAWGIMLGVGVARIVWDRGERDLPRLRVKHPRHLRFDDDALRWRFQARAGEVDVTPGDGLWVLYTPYGTVRPWAFGAYRALSRWALLKKYAIADWGSYSERHGHGMLVVTGVGGTKEQRGEIASSLRNLGRKAVIPLPKDTDLKLVEAEAKTYETFVAQIAAADNGAAVTILGQNLTTQAGETGNQGAASVHGKVALGRTKADAQTLSTTLHDQVLTWWAESNFGSRAAAPWPAWDTDAIADRKDEAALHQMISQALTSYSTAGAPVDVRALLEKFRVPTTPPVATDEKGTLYKYHFDYGVITKNEARSRLGLPPTEDGNEPPEPVNGAPGDTTEET